MSVNSDKTTQWKSDVKLSVDFYNAWFMNFAPKAFRETRIKTSKLVEQALGWTNNLKNISPDALIANPKSIQMLRMCTCPPIARDRLIGLAGVNSNMIKVMENEGVIPPRMKESVLKEELRKAGEIIITMADTDIFTWLETNEEPSDSEKYRAATIVADRLCGAVSDPIIRNAQEQRQLGTMRHWLEGKGYRELQSGEAETFKDMPKGTFSFRFNIPIYLSTGKKINIPVDALIMRKDAVDGEFPVIFEAKSAGDFTNTNKRRKEEAVKMSQLKATYGDGISFNLFLCGYFDAGYLGYEAAEGIDWVWEHRIDDLNGFNF